MAGQNSSRAGQGCAPPNLSRRQGIRNDAKHILLPQPAAHRLCHRTHQPAGGAAAGSGGMQLRCKAMTAAPHIAQLQCAAWLQECAICGQCNASSTAAIFSSMEHSRPPHPTLPPP
jgi:hypothetical protein